MSLFSIFSNAQTRFCCTLAVLATALGIVSSTAAGVFTKGETSYDTLAAATPTNGDTIVVNGDGYLGTSLSYSADTTLTLNGTGKITVLKADNTPIVSIVEMGAITNAQNKLTLNLENITFDGATCNIKVLGGVFKANNIELNVQSGKSVAFTNNNLSGNGYTRGGAIWANNGTINIAQNSVLTFDRNTASSWGGAICVNGPLTINAQGATLIASNNTSASAGGAFYTSNDMLIDVSNNGTAIFSGNSSTDSNGGAIYAGNLTINASNGGNVTFSNNTALYAGAIETGNLVINATDGTVLFKGNTTPNNEAGVIRASKIDLYGNVTFEDNQSQSQGAAIKTSGDITIHDGAVVTFKNNDAVLNNATSYSTAGAIYCGGNFTIEEGATVIFDGNDGTGHGGAIYASSGTINIAGNVTFMNNTIAGEDKDGGAIDAKNVIFSGDNTVVKFINNSSTNGDDILADNVTFNDNGTYSFDGGIVTEEGGNLTINDTASVTLAAGSESNIAGGVETTGTLLIDGNLNAYQDVAVKTGGTIGGSGNVTGDVTLDKGATLQLGIDKDGNAKALDVTGNVTLNEESKIEIVVDEEYLPSHGQTFDMPILNNIKVDTQKDNFDLNTLLSGDAASWFVLSVGEDGSLTAGVNPNYVPEPTTWVLMILGFAGLVCLRKRNQ